MTLSFKSIKAKPTNISVTQNRHNNFVFITLGTNYVSYIGSYWWRNWPDLVSQSQNILPVIIAELLVTLDIKQSDQCNKTGNLLLLKCITGTQIYAAAPP